MTKINVFACPKREALKPKRTSKELAQEFGIPHTSLVNLLKKEDAPRFALKNKNAHGGTDAWYDADAVRRWYAAICK